jgi:hypothetical protein
MQILVKTGAGKQIALRIKNTKAKGQARRALHRTSRA